MPVVNGHYEKRSVERIAEVVAAELRSEFGEDIDLTESSAFHHIVDAWASSVNQIQEEQLQTVYNAAYIDTATGENLENVVSILGISRQEANHATGVIEFSRDSPAVIDYTIPKGTVVQTLGPDVVQFETTEPVTIADGETIARADIRAIEGGIAGNVAANTITVLPSVPAGVEDITNPLPTGDSDYTDTDGDPLVTGTNTETDEELRARAKAVVTDGAVATQPAIYSALVSELPEVQSASIFVNPTDNDYRPDGLPPVSFEAVVYGGGNEEIANTLFHEMALTARSYSGAHGETVQVPITASNGQVYPIHFSRPHVQQVYMDIEVVTEPDFIGVKEIKNILIDYIGGTDVQGSYHYGRGVGGDLYVTEMVDLMVDIGGEHTGVLGVSEFEITDAAGTSISSQDPNGLSAVEIPADTVAETAPDQLTITTDPANPSIQSVNTTGTNGSQTNTNTNGN